MTLPLWPLLKTFSWQEVRRHPWRNAVAVLAVMLGVALAHAVHLINASALAEFAGATQALSGRPDLQLRARQGTLDDRWLDRLATHPLVATASPVLEITTQARLPDGQRLPLKLLGLDALSAAAINPALVARPDAPGDGARPRRLDLFAPDAVFLNAAAQDTFGRLGPDTQLALQQGERWLALRVAGSVAAGGAPLAVMDVAAAQDAFGRLGQLSGVDLRLRPGATPQALVDAMADGLPPELVWQTPAAAEERADRLSRAYRVNLTVLALVALFTGAFLVYSVLSLGVARRLPQFALLGVLGLGARERQALVLAESLLLGAVGSALGLLLGTALAMLALRLLDGDLGGGYFAGVAPRLHTDTAGALLYGTLGLLAAGLGGWWPARQARRLAPAQALKGLGAAASGQPTTLAGALLLAAALALAALPPVAGVPLAAYASVGLLLLGGIALLPALARGLLRLLAPRVATRALPLLALERARRQPEVAAVATGGVVASLALSVALTVMVGSFRDSVSRWLDVLLPAPLYLRGPAGAGPFFDPARLAALAALPGVARIDGLRVLPLQLDPARPPVALIARPLREPARELPLLAPPLPAPAGTVPVYASEAFVALYGAVPGQPLPRLGQALGGRAEFFVAGVWRDYARQQGSLVLPAQALEQLTGEARFDDLAVYLRPGARADEVAAALRQALADAVEVTSAEAVRAQSLRIFDRSFAVTYWLQAVAIGIGLFGVAASFGAQVLARRREFGLLAHLGLTPAQVRRLVAGEGLVWTALGTLAGLALGLGVSVLLVHVVNPQSFHWTMELSLPWPRLLALCAAVLACGTVTAWLAARAVASADVVRAVREDW